MKIIFSLIICTPFLIFPQQVPTTLYEIYKNEVKFDFSQNPEKVIGEWSERLSMPYPRYYGASIMYSKNDTTWLYIFGGDTTSNGDATNACLRYNVNADTWEYIDSLPTPMRVNSAARLGDKLYTMGGFNGISDTAIKKFYEYDVNTNLWSELPELPEGIYYHKSIGYQDSLIYIIGGIQSDSTDFRDRIFLYNVNTREFRDATPLPEQRANFALTGVNNSLIITGGFYDSDSLSNKTIIASIDPLDHAQLTYFISIDSASHYPIQVHSHFGYPLGTDSINFFGGSKTTGFSPINDSYTFKIPQNVYDIAAIIPISITAFHSGYSYTFINPGFDSVLTVVIAGGVTPGPFITGRTWIYRDTLSVTDIDEPGNGIPSGFSLKQNYPNPFNPVTVISWQLPNKSFVSLKIYDVLGKEVAELINEEQPAGTHHINFDAGSLSSGVYFYKLQAGNFTQTKKLLLIK